MTSETKHEGNIGNSFQNSIRIWQNYLINWIEANRNIYENVIKTNEQWLEAIWYPLPKARDPSQTNSKDRIAQHQKIV